MPARAVAAALLLLLAPAGSFAQVAAAPPVQAPLPAIGQPVVEVRLVVDGRPVDDGELRRALDTAEGAPLSAADVRESILHLMALQRFQDVQVSADAAPNGVVLTYAMQPRDVITGMDFEGDLGLSARRLRATLIERWAGTPPLERASDAAAGLAAYLRERGYRGAKVAARTRPEGNHTATLVFDMAAGPRVRVTSLQVNGAEGEKERVASALNLSVGSPFDPGAALDRVDQYGDRLRSRGFYDARVELVTTYSDDGRGVDLVIDIARGPHVTVVFRGDPIPREKREEVLPLNREGGLDEDRLEDASIEIERDLRAQGYREATAPYTREQGPGGETLLVFTVRRGPQYKIAGVVIEGAAQLPVATFRPMLATAAGQWFVQSRVDGDVARLTEEYRRRGFREAKVSAAVTSRTGAAEPLIDVRFTVVEGSRLTIGAFTFEGNQVLPATTLRAAVQSRPGAPYYQPQINADRDAILSLYLDRGYQLASVGATAQPVAGSSQVDLLFQIQEGPRMVIDRVLVVGNQRIDALAIERQTGLTSGMPVSPQVLADARRRLAAMGLFRRAQVSELQLGSGTERDVLVEVEEGPVNTIGYGAGLEGLLRLKRDTGTGGTVERFDVAPRGFFEFGRRNLFGGNRTINLFMRGAIRSSDLVNASREDAGAPAVNPLEDNASGFREYRVLATYREPGFIGLPIDVAVTGVFDQAIRSSYDFNRRQAFIEGSHRFGRLSAAGRYSLGRTRVFNDRIAPEDRLIIDRLFNPGLRLSTFAVSGAFDTRDDPVSPTRGALLLFDTGLAARRFGSDMGFVRSYAQSFVFREIPRLRGTVLAAGVRVGLARGFPRMIRQLDADGNPVPGPDGQPILVEARDVPASERFFAGGDTTVRGFAQDRLGTPQVLDRNGVSRGGQAVVIVNGELRFPILSGIGLGGAAFVDVGNVFPRATDIAPGRLRTGIGLGIRWSSPVGPLRVDLGWKVTRHRFPNGEREDGFAPHITIGQAF
jgi:outer membrane protein assembly factor BamA